MAYEMKSLDDNKVWFLTELPEGRMPVGSKWVFKVKIGVVGSVECYKACLVAQGFSQKFGTDYDETFCPVVRQESLRALIALGVQMIYRFIRSMLLLLFSMESLRKYI